MRENRPYGSEGGESGSTGLPYPYSLCWVLTAQRSVPASAPLKAFNQLGASPDQGNVTALYPTVVTAFP